MRSKLIISGAIGVLAAATLTVNAENDAHSRVAPARSTLKAHAFRHEVLTIATRATAAAAAAAQNVRPVVAKLEEAQVVARPASSKLVLSTGCQAAIGSLKSLQQAELTEDASEKPAVRSEAPVSVGADRAEDAAESKQWMSSLAVARAACLPQRSHGCQSAIGGLEAVLQSLQSKDIVLPRPALETAWAAQAAALRTAFTSVRAACA